MSYQCPVCNKFSVKPNGRQNADWLIVGETPSFDDVRIGLPFTGKLGEFLGYELARVGIQLSACRLVTINPHIDAQSECVKEHFVNICMPELYIPRKGILIIGNTAPNFLGMVNTNIKDIQGLNMSSIPSLGITGNIVYTSELYGVINGYLGELRLALTNLKKGIQ